MSSPDSSRRTCPGTAACCWDTCTSPLGRSCHRCMPCHSRHSSTGPSVHSRTARYMTCTRCCTYSRSTGRSCHRSSFRSCHRSACRRKRTRPAPHRPTRPTRCRRCKCVSASRSFRTTEQRRQWGTNTCRPGRPHPAGTCVHRHHSWPRHPGAHTDHCTAGTRPHTHTPTSCRWYRTSAIPRCRPAWSPSRRCPRRCTPRMPTRRRWRRCASACRTCRTAAPRHPCRRKHRCYKSSRPNRPLRRRRSSGRC